eukprot:9563-Ditylum_brightwellii.AAC.1
MPPCIQHKNGLRKKAQFVADGHMTEAPVSITYSSVMTQESMRLAFVIAKLNVFSVKTCDIGNAYLNAPCHKRSGSDVVLSVGKMLPRRKNVKKDGSKYYELILDGAKDPSIFLGANIEKFQLANRSYIWSTMSKQYVKNDVMALKYLQLIGILQWAVEFGWIDIATKKQNIVESSTFGLELVAFCIAKDMIAALCTKSCMFGVPVEGPSDVLCDDAGVVKNTRIPENMLINKHNSINCHSVQAAAAAAAGIIHVGKEDSVTNLADALTKFLT